jgi:dihydroorotase
MPNSVQLDNNEYDITGLIDFHAHIFEHHGHPGFNLNADAIGVESGVLTVVDQGGAGALTLDSFKQHIVNKSKTHVQCFVSPYLVGGNPRGEMAEVYGPLGMNAKKTVDAVRLYDPNYDFVRGVKAHCGPSNYDKWGIEPLRVAQEIAQELKLPLYVHLGSLWNFPDTAVPASKIVDQVLEILRPGDILAHPYRPENGLVSPQGVIHPAMAVLKQKGILIDSGRGTKFSFRNVRILMEHGYQPDIISTDLHGYGRPSEHNLLRAMNEMLHLGMSADSIVNAVTHTPRQYLKNCPTAHTKLCIVNESASYMDSTGERIEVSRMFRLQSI